MGHERISFLPHTKQWKAIIESLFNFGDGSTFTIKIANDILDAAVRIKSLGHPKITFL